MTTETFTTPGQGIWTCPAGVSSLQREMWGAGGGGGGNSVTSDGAGGGAGGGYGRNDALTVSAGNLYTYFIGTAGVGVTSLDGTTGGDTWWIDATTYKVPGGPFGGVRVANGGAGGTAILTSNAAFVGTFTLKTSGGNGGNGVNNNSGGGGGGGGSGGDTTSGSAGGVGTAGTGGAGGVAGTTNGGIGGVGGSGTANGIAPVSGNGGGGGGSGEGVVKGGDGTVGKIILTYTIVAPTTSPGGLHHIPQGIGDTGEGARVPQTLHPIESGITA